MFRNSLNLKSTEHSKRQSVLIIKNWICIVRFINLRPELYKVIIAVVTFVDVVTPY